MKIWKKILFIGIIAFVFIFSAVYLFTMAMGRTIIIDSLGSLFHKKVSMGYFRLTLPFKLEIKDLNIEGLAQADYVCVVPNILGFMMGKVVLNEVKVVNPKITYEKAQAGTGDLASLAANLIFNQKRWAEEFNIKNLVVKRINIKNGKVIFFDRTVGENGIKITVKDISFILHNAYIFPRSVITNFELKGRIPWEHGQEEGKIDAEGWLNILKKDMQATLKIEDIDGIYLYPYYAKWVDLEKGRIEKAKLNLVSNIQGLNNNITAQNRIELTDIVRSLRLPKEPVERAERMADKVLSVFRDSDEGRIALDFSINTKLDTPEFGFSDIKTAVESKLTQMRSAGSGLKPQDVLLLPLRLIEGSIKGVTDISKAVIGGTLAVGNELKEAAEGSFRKKNTAE